MLKKRDLMEKSLKRSSFVEGTLIATIAIVFTKILGMLYVIPFYGMLDGKGTALYGYAYTIYLFLRSAAMAACAAASLATGTLNGEHDT